MRNDRKKKSGRRTGKRKRMDRKKELALHLAVACAILLAAGLTAAGIIRSRRKTSVSPIPAAVPSETETDVRSTAESMSAFVENLLDTVESETPDDPTDSNSSPLAGGGIRPASEDEIRITDTSGDWRLILVNPRLRLPEDYAVDTCRIWDGEPERIDYRIYDDLHAMLNACESANLFPIIRGAYRTQNQQEELFEQKTEQFMMEGETLEEARRDAATIVAYPGTSEHQLGLALDIVSGDNNILNADQANNPTQQWLMEHSFEYGFVLRYPTDKGDITGIIYEPWHYRYVGTEAAKVMHDENLCLEEYLDKYGNGGESDDEA